jgi:HEAT repeat protein
MPRSDLNRIEILVLITQLVMSSQHEEAAKLAAQDGRAYEHLRGMLHQTGRDACREAAHVLAHMPKLGLLPLLEGVVHDKHGVRRASALGLGELGNARAMPLLISALNDRHYTVRRAACEALGELGEREATLPLLTKLWDESAAVRRAAARALGELGDDRAEADLSRLAANDPEVSQAARTAMERIRRAAEE